MSQDKILNAYFYLKLDLSAYQFSYLEITEIYSLTFRALQWENVS